MLRDWTASEKINILSVHAERFFVRLIMKVDDYGCFHANDKLLKSFLFPLSPDGVREADISRWMAECQTAGLIVLYEAEGKRYLQIQDFRQRLDRSKSKFPLPLSTVNDFPPEVEVEKKGKESAKRPDLSKSNLYRQPNIPTLEKVVEAFLNQGGTKEMAVKFFESNNGTGWFYKGSPVTNFSNLVPGYISSWKKNEKKESNYQSGSAPLRIG